MKFTRLGKFLGKLGFGYCPDCGTKMWYDYDRQSKGYTTFYKCLHCDYLDRFDVVDKDIIKKVVRELEKWEIPYKAYKMKVKKPAVPYIRCIDCGVGVGCNNRQMFREARREFIKAHWGHKKEEAK